MKFKITFSGRFHYRKGSGVVPHFHPDNQLQLVYSGEGCARVNNEKKTITAEDIVFIRKGSSHDFHAVSTDGMKTLEVKFITKDSEAEDVLSSLPVILRDQNRQVFEILSHIVLEGQRKMSYFRSMSEALLLQGLLRLCRMNLDENASIPLPEMPHSLTQSGSRSRLLVSVDDFIAENIHRTFSLSEMADFCGYNQDYLYRVVKKETGMSTVRYVNLVRFERAKSLIQHTELTLTEIAWNLGFENIQYFTRFFKNHAGYPPSNYLSRVRTTIRTDYE